MSDERDAQFTFHLKHDVVADLPATATVIVDPAERRRVLAAFVEEFNRRHSPDSPWPKAVLDEWVVDWLIPSSAELAQGFGYTLPSGFGHDFAGTVDEVGEGMEDFAVGDRVYGGVLGQAVADYGLVKPDAARLSHRLTLWTRLALLRSVV